MLALSKPALAAFGIYWMKIITKRSAAAIAAGGAQAWLWAQTNVAATNETVTNVIKHVDAPFQDIGTPPGPVLPSTPSDYWAVGIGIVTPFIVAGVRKLVPTIPPALLPAITPVIGILLGLSLNWLAGAHLGWFDAAKAGALAVFFREVVNQTITKRLQDSTPSPTTPTTPTA